MNKIYYLGTCSTCNRIVKELELDKHNFEFQDIKTEKMTAEQVDAMAKASGSYESLFSRRAMKFRSEGLHEKELNEQDYKALILREYTFLKRPVIVIGNEHFVGNSKSTVAAAKKALS